MSLATDRPETDNQPRDRYEVVNGMIVEVPPMSGFAAEVANRIRDELGFHARASRTGRARSDMTFRIPLPEDLQRNRIPDAAFISFARWPEDRPMPYRGNPVDVVPDLVAEVASPTDPAEALLDKAYEYLRGGVRLVWVVYPRLRQIHAYTRVGAPPALFTESDTLDGGDVLPGFTIPTVNLFPAMEDMADEEDDE